MSSPIVGAVGALVSMVTATADDAALVWPDELVAVAVSVCFASVRTLVM